jgi:hypothetical protein
MNYLMAELLRTELAQLATTGTVEAGLVVALTELANQVIDARSEGLVLTFIGD